jgi:hypothetical protein
MRMSSFLGALVVVTVTAGLAGCGSGEDTRHLAAEAAEDLKGQKVPGVGAVKRAQCVNPPLSCIVNNAEGYAASCEVASASDDQSGFYCKRTQPVSEAEVNKTCAERETEHFEQAEVSSVDWECAMARKPSKLPPTSAGP